MSYDRRERRVAPWVIIALVAVLLLLLGCACISVVGVGWFARAIPWISETGIDWGEGRANVEAVQESQRSFDVPVPAVVTIENDVGSIEVIGSAGMVVEVQTTVRSWGRTVADAEEAAEFVALDMAQQENGEVVIRAEIREQLTGRQSPSVHLQLRVPQDCVLNIEQGVGDVQVTGVQGAGRIALGVGNVDLQQVAPMGSYNVTVGVGDVSMTVIEGLAFELIARTSVGDIRNNLGLAPSDGPVDERVDGVVGTDPQARVNIRVDTGSIRIEQE